METRMPESQRKELSSNYRQWESEEVKEFLTGVNLANLPFEPKNGDDLDKLLVEIEQKRKPLNRDSQKAQSLIKSLQYQQYKIYNDPIHGSIEVHPLVDKIINTPEFHRLKDIKQLGGAHYVYPGAMHTRFEHSIGVCYIAGEFARCLQHKQPELEITDKDVLCVQIAGLCHDLGHGPFSHLFEKKVVKKIVKELVEKGELPKEYEWEHEKISKLVFERIYMDEDLKKNFKRYGLGDTEFEFIKDMMEGCRSVDDRKPKERFFFYEIVANKITGIDVDKWDYFARDCHYLGIPNDFEWRRCMLLSRVIEDPTGHYRICFRDKEAKNIYGMFRTRSSLHQRAYQHKTTSVMEHMIAETICKAKDIALVRIGPGEEGVKTIQQVVKKACKGNVEGYLQLTDHIIQQIKCAEVGPGQPQLEEAQELLKRIEKRDHFHCVEVYCTQRRTTPEEVKKFLEKKVIREDIRGDDISEGDIHVMVIPFRFGSEKEPENPIDAVPFYHKDYPWKLETKPKVHQTVSKLMIPKEFKETEVRVYNKKSKKHSEKIAKAFKEWCDHPECTPEKPASQDRHGNPETCRCLFQESQDS